MIFSREEFETRLARVRSRMDARGLEVLFVEDPSNMAWLTGYDGWSFYVHQGVLVGREGEPVFWGRAMDAAGALRTCWMAPEAIVAYGDDYVMNESCHPMTHLVSTLAERGWTDARLGVEMENYYYSARAHSELTRALGAEPLDATGLVNRCRAVKSEAELACMRRAARIVERMHARIREIFAPGVRKNDVVAEIYRTAIVGAEDADGTRFGGDYAAICPLLPSGRDASAAHLTWDDAPVETGQGTFFEIAGCYRRYHAPLCRTIWLGTPPREVAFAEEVLREGITAGIDKARAGNTAGDVARAFHAVLRRRGLEREGRCGYPVGLSYPPDWGERTFSFRESDETVLEADMTVHFMPGLWTPEWGLELTETLRIRTGAPAETLANVPRKLIVEG